MTRSFLQKIINNSNNDKKRILKQVYKSYSVSNDCAQKEFADFVRKHMRWSDKLFDTQYAPAFIFGGEWTLEYLNKEYRISYSEGYPFVYYHGVKLFMPMDMNEKEIISYVQSIEIEQDRRSAHCYFPKKANLKGKVLVDIGAAEGNFAIDYIDEISSLYIFETEEKWIKPLNMTFEKWKDKVTIINQFVGDGKNNTLRLDDFFPNHGSPDLIKVDVEGAEASVLRGAQRIISSSKCLTLFVCLYHDGNDEEEIKELLMDYRCEYRDGYMFYIWEQPIKEPYLRHGVAEFTRSGLSEN